ncbi:MAG: NAD(P)-dependent oxidoreductase [Elusimicrobia bacterium]|nr:NAD(P)-dependent oxidoreductase [Elusimicrobiota bacterium]
MRQRQESDPVPLKEIEANFEDIHPPLKPEQAAIEANRCLYCYDAPCMTACPTHIEVPRFIKQIAAKNPKGAAKIILEANPMGHSCARVCPVEALCEGACVYHDWHQKPIEIARLQRAATDFVYSRGARLFEAGVKQSKKVAVIGAGPAGLSTAFYLRRLGYPVTIFEKRPLAGGLNTYGIAEYKMTQATALQETQLVAELGAEFKFGVEIGKDISWEKLEKEYDAVFVGIGLGRTQALNIPGEELSGVSDALSFIEQIKTRKFDAITPGRVTVVIGAGNTAIDAVTQAKRLGTPKVILAYRRSRNEMSAYDYEYELAKKDAVEFLWNAAPKKIVGKGKAEGIEFVRTKTEGVGRKAELKIIPGSEFIVPCDRVIKAVGQMKQRSVLERVRILELDATGRIAVNSKTLQSSNPKYFAGGDAINGGKEVVNAAQDGKRAAWAIHCYLGGDPQPAPEHAYWVSTIDVRRMAPPLREKQNPKHEQKKELSSV